MNEVDRDITNFILVFLNSPEFSGKPVASTAIYRAVRGAHKHLALTEGHLYNLINFLEREGFIAGTNDEFDGPVWALTSKGKIRAQ